MGINADKELEADLDMNMIDDETDEEDEMEDEMERLSDREFVSDISGDEDGGLSDLEDVVSHFEY
jgi:protein MAK16